jgi:hypothetical protein
VSSYGLEFLGPLWCLLVCSGFLGLGLLVSGLALGGFFERLRVLVCWAKMCSKHWRM